MIEKRRITLNTAASALQVVVGGVTLFLLYRFLLGALGKENVGVWSLVLATTSATSIANLGLASSTVKFVSQHLARGDRRHAASLVETATLSVALFLALALAIAYPVLRRVLPLLIDDLRYLDAGLSLIPYALTAFWIASVAGVLHSSIDGCQRVDLRGYTVAAGNILYLALAYVLVPKGGLIALAYAQIAQSTWLLVSAYLILRRLLPELPWVAWSWRMAPFREMLSYTLNFQLISLSQLLLEPVTKSLVSRFGGLGTLAYVEMAHRMVFQFRSLVATAHRAIVPTIASLQETAPDYLRTLYIGSFRLLLFIVIVSTPGLIALSPWVSRIWIGDAQTVFIFSAGLFYVGWFLNLLANPAYFANLGTGALFWNVTAHVGMGILNLAGGFLLGRLFGWSAVVGAMSGAIVAGSAVIVLAYHRAYRIRLDELMDGSTLVLLAAALLGAIVAWQVDRWASRELGALMHGLAVGLTYAGVVAWPLARNPVVREIAAWFRRHGQPDRA